MFYLLTFYIFLKLLLKYSCLHFPSTTPPSPPPPLPPSILPSLALSMSPLYMFLDNPPPSFPHYPSPPFPMVTASLFFISMSLVVFCLLVCFVDQVPIIGESIWYLSFTAWLTLLSIMLSSSIHAVTKGRSSFSFFPLCSIPLCKCTSVFIFFKSLLNLLYVDIL